MFLLGNRLLGLGVGAGARGPLLRSLLDWDFTTGIPDDFYQYHDRTSGATTINENGNIVWANENLATRSNSPANWYGELSGVTEDYGDGPLSGYRSSRIQLSGSQAISSRRTSGWGDGVGSYTASIYIRSLTGVNQNLLMTYFNQAIGGGDEAVVATPEWQRIDMTFEPGQGVGYIQVGIKASGALVDVEVSAIQLQRGSTPGKYLHVTGSELHHAPRLTHDPYTLQPLGYLNEYQETQNGNVYTNWLSEASIFIGIAGQTILGWQSVGLAVQSTAACRGNFAAHAAGNHVEFYVEFDSASRISICFSTGTDYASFNDEGVASGTGIEAKMVEVAPGTFKCTAYRISGVADINVRFGVNNANPYWSTSGVGETCRITEPNITVAQGSVLHVDSGTSLIPPSASGPVIRQADTVDPAIINKAITDGGTMVFSGRIDSNIGSGSERYVYTYSSGAGANSDYFGVDQRSNTAASWRFIVKDNNTTTNLLNVIDHLNVGSSFKHAQTFDSITGTQKVAINGVIEGVGNVTPWTFAEPLDSFVMCRQNLAMIVGSVKVYDSYHDDAKIIKESSFNPSLSLNFLDPTFPALQERDSTATYVDADGLVQTAEVDVPRITHDIDTGERYYLKEKQATNSLDYGMDLNSGDWEGNRYDIASNDGGDSPIAGEQYWRFVHNEQSSNFYTARRISTAYPIGTQLVVSVFVKEGDLPYFSMYDRAGTEYGARFRYATESISGHNVDDAGVEKFANGYRVWMVITTTLATQSFYFTQSSADSFSGGGAFEGAEFFMAGVNMVEGDTLSSHIPTYGAPAIRQADSCNIGGNNFNSIWQRTGGTMVLKGRMLPDIALNNLLMISNGNARRWLYGNFSGNGTSIEDGVIYDGTSTPVLFNDKRLDQDWTIALAIKDDEIRGSFNGEAVTSAAHDGSLLTSVSDIIFAENSGMELQSFDYYPVALADSKLQELTL